MAEAANQSIKKSGGRFGESCIVSWLGVCAAVSVITTAAIIGLLLKESYVFF